VQQTSIAEVTETDDAGNVIAEAGTTLEGNAGIATSHVGTSWERAARLGLRSTLRCRPR
jgi:lipid-binding SYLF domain-containing protein